ncbi:AAA domain-containing protein [Planococcus salinarum]|uniref:AAA domain-containing protein n=1 Tax=Planococcus salinarum TaxID=622695 RepID=UPI000E3D99F4|nr:AAA domain-containing protein [Planococcus salinarum]TAA73081.1 ATP-dependent helicase [Planococcus salinarum]
MVQAQTNTYKTSIRITKTASEKMRGFGISERSFFIAGQPFQVFMERYPSGSDGSLSVALFFGREETRRLATDVKGLIVLHCVFRNHQLLVTNVTLRKAYQALGTNWQREESVVFTDSRDPVPVAFINLINRMTPAKERSDYVKKRISSWEGYLKIQEQGMDIPDIKTPYSSFTFNPDFSRITLTGCRMNDKEWKSLRKLSVRLTGIEGDVGTVLKASNKAVEVELNPYIIKQLREKGHGLTHREVVFSNFAALSQIRRLRQGFTNLEKGLAVNPQLDRLLFEEEPKVAPLKALEKLTYHNRLNEFQQQAVSGAVAAEDLYVIQGPPGTGKTTVISEICLQNAKKGLRTLVASQSNLAVDNALGRLLANKDIRILRVGRTESIEEEGKKFIEENVGQYWKDSTLKEISSQYDTRAKRETEVAKKLAATERAYDELQPVFESLKKAVADKKDAAAKQKEIESLLNKERQKLQAFELQREQSQQEERDSEQKLETLAASIAEDQAILDSGKDMAWYQHEELRISKVIQQLEHARRLDLLQEETAAKKQDIATTTDKRGQVSQQISGKTAALQAIDSVKKVDEGMQLMAQHEIEETTAITYAIGKLDMIRDKMAERKNLEKINTSLTAAIAYVEKLLAPTGVALDKVKEDALAQTGFFTMADIEGFLDKLRIFLKSSPSIDPSALGKALTGLYKRQNELWRRGAELKSPEMYIEDSKRSFQQLKGAIGAELQKQQQQYEALDAKWLSELERMQQNLDVLQQQATPLPADFDIPPDIEEAIHLHKVQLAQVEKDKVSFEQVGQRLESLQKEQLQEIEALEISRARIGEIDGVLGQVRERLDSMHKENESLLEILSSDPETDYETTAKQLASLSFDKESLKQEQKSLPLMQTIQKKWLDLLKDANDHDLDEIRKLYIKHANVIGTTCVASARKDFIDNYPEFDVVIIDEVSKATPPELLLPMLKGKKIILVGDHHQLPPLLGNDTLEETLEEMIKENSGFEEKRELEKLLEESLFERLYRNLPESNKTMLAIQYRMHADIMETIAPFYKFDNDQLQCGLADSDRERDHFLESLTVKRSNHLMWVDLPNEPAYFEERMSGGKSLYNPVELQEISRMLVELNDAVAEAKSAGRIAPDELKTVGVISFYGEQVKRLQRMIDQELRLPHLTIRTGTVDRFQGSEMEIILLSMVRNNQNNHGDIGFAKDYRRLNVALSRAKQLLVLIGSSDMFTKRAKKEETKRMYRHVLETVEKKNGVKVLQKG